MMNMSNELEQMGKGKNNLKFSKGYFHAPNDIFEQEHLKVQDKMVYLYICRCAHNSTAFPSYNTIAKKCSISRSSAVRSVQRLEKEQLLIKKVRKNSVDNRNKSNTYEVLPPSISVTPLGISETPNKETKEKRTKETTRYIITNNDDSIFSYYAFKYKKHFKKEHPTVTKEQLDRLSTKVSEFRIELDVGNEEWEEAIDEHFKHLGKKNNGNILAFLSGNTLEGPLVRYFMMEDEKEHKYDYEF